MKDDSVLMTTPMPDEDPQPDAAHSGGPERPLFARRFTSSPKGARLARRLAVRRMGEWGWPPASDASCTVSLLVGELAANAVTHGRVPGRDFRLVLEVRGDAIRVEVSDASPIRPPAVPSPSSEDDESGRGLLLVDILATRWGAVPRDPVGKTVWAEVPALPDVPGPSAGEPGR
ncbi:ATP-binding protein [Streptomyces sp. DH37]|uniref:ATP-binding protein n=1 Tax=Streptomyces sp. DH37 TaxID=3040122 RepID=UPI002441F660|nr:ATP-binding protein [Streptomyces sp. DH37]MDG9705687.1 ATP-binding protein [Streptomyces sp. DH37]